MVMPVIFGENLAQRNVVLAWNTWISDERSRTLSYLANFPTIRLGPSRGWPAAFSNRRQLRDGL